jgi:hypothetical protein
MEFGCFYKGKRISGDRVLVRAFEAWHGLTFCPCGRLCRVAAIDLAIPVRHKGRDGLHLGGVTYEKGLCIGHGGLGRVAV